MDQLGLIDIYRAFHPKTVDCTFFLSAHETFSMINRILVHKSSLVKFKKMEVILSIFSDQNSVRFYINSGKKKTITNTNTWRLNNTFLNNQEIAEEIKEEIKKIPRSK